MTRTAKGLVALVLLGAGASVVLAPRIGHTLTVARAGTAQVAMTLCSGVLLSGMDSARLMNEELVAGRGLVKARILEDAGEVTATAFGGLVKARAKRQGDLGCSLYHKADPPNPVAEIVRPGPSDPISVAEPWRIDPSAGADPPQGIDETALKAALDDAFSEPDPRDPRRTRAVVVVQDGWVVAERYAPGIEPTMPLIGWSMTKSITHALVGIAAGDGLLALDRPIPAPEWAAPDDPRRSITLEQLLRMSSGLAFGERYDDFASDVVVMLALAPDAGAFAADKPLAFEPGTHWAYSSGTTNIISRGLRLAIDDDASYWRFPYERLFEPLGMRTAVLETDPSGTFVGSSLGFASGRDWARFGLLYLNDGEWNGERLLPEGWVEEAVTPTPGSRDGYGAHWWLNRGGEFPELPADAYRAAGFDGQYVLVVPSRNAVIVRLGQTPGDGFDLNAFASAVLRALPGTGESH